MKLIAAYLPACLGGNSSPSPDDIRNILASVGAEVDDDRLELLFAELKGKDITEVIAAGREKFAFVPSSGGTVAMAAPAGGGSGGAAPIEAASKEKVEEKEESDEDMNFSLFD